MQRYRPVLVHCSALLYAKLGRNIRQVTKYVVIPVKKSSNKMYCTCLHIIIPLQLCSLQDGHGHYSICNLCPQLVSVEPLVNEGCLLDFSWDPVLNFSILISGAAFGAPKTGNMCGISVNIDYKSDIYIYKSSYLCMHVGIYACVSIYVPQMPHWCTIPYTTTCWLCTSPS